MAQITMDRRAKVCSPPMVRAVADDAAGDRDRGGEDPERPASRPRSRDAGVALVALVVVAAALFRPVLEDLLDRPAIAHWATVFVAIVVQAMPFLVLGVTISAAVAALVPGDLLARVLPSRPGLAVPAAAAAGVALPGCECGSVPIAARLVDRGMLPAAALAFLLSAPAINPIVLVATAVAFPGQPEVVVARFVASLLAATIVGLIWAQTGNDGLLRMARRRPVGEGSPLSVMMVTAQHDLLNAGGFLIIGAGTAATLQTVVPRSTLESLGGAGVVAFLAMSGLAVIMAICSEADAFVAASFTAVPMTARLAFMVVGPMVDVKLIALQSGTFGRAFATRFAPLTLVVAMASSALIGWWLL
jgi:uncharacterized membrane protein YraQ (UPF0718 family)